MARICLTLLFLPSLPWTLSFGGTPARSSEAPAAGFREAPEFLPLFTPPRAPAGLYRTYTSRQGLDDVLRTLRQDSSLTAVPGDFEPQSVIAAEAFGQSGGYNRWSVARLYGAKRARVARRPRIEEGHVVEAWTLISPHPDVELKRLEPGTLLIVLRVH